MCLLQSSNCISHSSTSDVISYHCCLFNTFECNSIACLFVYLFICLLSWCRLSLILVKLFHCNEVLSCVCFPIYCMYNSSTMNWNLQQSFIRRLFVLVHSISASLHQWISLTACTSAQYSVIFHRYLCLSTNDFHSFIHLLLQQYYNEIWDVTPSQLFFSQTNLFDVNVLYSIELECDLIFTVFVISFLWVRLSYDVINAL